MIQKDSNFKKIEKYKNKLLKVDIYNNKKIECCPHCNSIEYIKYGKYDGIQRYKCKDCIKTFSKTTKALWSYSKKDAEKWIKFMEYTLEKKTLRYCAKELEINLVTAFYWRHKILQALTLDMMTNNLKGEIFINRAIQKENFKGIRKRKPDRRRDIWIIAAKDNLDSMLITEIGLDFWHNQAFNEKVYSKIEKDSYIMPVLDRYIKKVAKKHNKEILSATKEENKIKYFRRNLRLWIESFSGIATKYLKRYLHYFMIFNVNKEFDYVHLTYDLSLKNRFTKTCDIRNCQCIEEI